MPGGGCTKDFLCHKVYEVVVTVAGGRCRRKIGVSPLAVRRPPSIIAVRRGFQTHPQIIVYETVCLTSVFRFCAAAFSAAVHCACLAHLRQEKKSIVTHPVAPVAGIVTVGLAVIVVHNCQISAIPSSSFLRRMDVVSRDTLRLWRQTNGGGKAVSGQAKGSAAASTEWATVSLGGGSRLMSRVKELGPTYPLST